MLNNILKKIILVGLFVLPLVPFVVIDGFFFPFIAGKAFVFRILVEIIFAAWLILALRDVEYRPKRSWILGAVTFFVLVIGIANTFGINSGESFWSNFERMEGYITVLHFAALALVAGTMLNTAGLWDKLLKTTLGASAVLAFHGLAQVTGLFGLTSTNLGSSSQAAATFGNSSYLGGYLLLHIFIALLLFVRTRSTKMKWLYGATMLFEAYVLVQTNTRGAILALLGGLFLAALGVAIFGKRETPRLRKVAAGGMIAVVLLVGIFIAAKDTPVVQSVPELRNLSTISFFQDTGYARYLVWGMAIDGFKEQPILGWGQDNFDVVFNKYYVPEMFQFETWYDRAHNIFLDWLVAGGILGLLGYVGMFAAALYALFRAREWSVVEKSVLFGLLAAYVAHNMFVFDNVVSYMLFAFILGYFVWKETEEKEQRVFGGMAISEVGQNVAAGVVVAALVWVLYAGTVLPMNVSSTLVDALRARSGGEYARSLGLFKEALAYNTNAGRQEVREQLLFSAQAVVGEESIPNDVRADYFATAVSEMTQQAEEDPTDARTQLFLGSFLTTFGQFDRAEPHLEKALELSPHKQEVFYALARNELGQEDFEKAVEYARTTYDESKESSVAFQDSRGRSSALRMYVGTLLAAGKQENMETVMADAVEHTRLAYEEDKQDSETLGAYVLTLSFAGQYDEAFVVLDEAVEIDPSREQRVQSTRAAIWSEKVVKDLEAGRPLDEEALVAAFTIYKELDNQQSAAELVQNIARVAPEIAPRAQAIMQAVWSAGE